jgi:hypothetical protein
MLSEIKGKLTCDGVDCTASVVVEMPHAHDAAVPAGWVTLTAHTSERVLPKVQREQAELAIAAAPDGGAEQMRDYMEKLSVNFRMLFFWQAHLCAVCQDKPLSLHLKLALAREQAQSDARIGTRPPWEGFAVMEGTVVPREDLVPALPSTT